MEERSGGAPWRNPETLGFENGPWADISQRVRASLCLAMATQAKSRLMRRCGKSPIQVVQGRDDAVPSSWPRSTERRSNLAWIALCWKNWRYEAASAFHWLDGRCGTFEEDLQRCIFRGRRSTRDMFIRDVRRSGRWFPERGCILVQIFRFAEMTLRDRCSTSYDLASLFVAGAIL